jgi:DNA-binding transcriptional ArsR family regulator
MYNHMVVHRKSDLKSDKLFHALSDTTRRSIVTRCLQGDHTVTELARSYPMSFAAVQKHVAVLERAELVTKQRRGREQLVSGNVQSIRYAFDVLEQFEELWRGRLNRMEQLITQNPKQGATK